MENLQMIHKVYGNYEKKQVCSFHFTHEIEKINELIAREILDIENFFFLEEENSMLQLGNDPFTRRGWEFFLGI